MSVETLVQQHLDADSEEQRAMRRLVRIGSTVVLSVAKRGRREVYNGRVVGNHASLLEVRFGNGSGQVDPCTFEELTFPQVPQLAPISAVAVSFVARDDGQLIVRVPASELRENRRIALRAGFSLPVAVKRGGEVSTVLGETVNVSGGGLQLLLGEWLGLRENVRIELGMPDAQGGLLDADAAVVWRKKGNETEPHHAFGLQFVGMAQEDIKRLCRMTLRKLAVDQRFGFLRRAGGPKKE